MRSLSALLFLALPFALSAQWSTDPANPTVLCDAANEQTALRTITDGSDGWYCFWADKRADNTHAQLYGQHIDAMGDMLWVANGVLLASVQDSTILDLAPVRMSDGSIIIAYCFSLPGSGQGGVQAIRIDADGTALWADPIALAHGGASSLGPINGFGNMHGMANGNEAYIAWSYIPQFNNDTYAWERVRLDGTTRFGAPGHNVPNSGWGPFSMHSDQKQGIIFDWRMGNGSGAPLQAMRVDSSGANVWASNLTVSQGTGGLAYAFKTIDDGAGANYSAWVALQAGTYDIGMAKYDTTAAFQWTPTPNYACNESHAQDLPTVLLANNAFYVGWSDGRPPAATWDMYMQKFDLDGTPQWTANGIPIFQFNSYIPHADVVESDNGAVIATFNVNANGFIAQRVLSDGTLAWATPGVFCTNAYEPFYENRVVLPEGDGGAVAFWENVNGNLYCGLINHEGGTGGISDVGIHEASANSAFDLFPDPAQDHLNVVSKDGTRVSDLSVTDATGHADIVMKNVDATSTSVDVASLAPGLYLIRLRTAAGESTRRFVKQ